VTGPHHEKPCQGFPHRTGRVLARFDGNVETRHIAKPDHTGRTLEHDQGEKPKGIGAQSVPCYVRIVGMDKKLMPKAMGKTVCCRVVHWHVVKLPHTDLGTRLARIA